MCVPVSGYIRRILLIAALFFTVNFTSASGQLQLPSDDTIADARADQLLNQMTLDEKIQLVHGVTTSATVPRGGAGFVPGIARLHIPDLYLADGSVGVGNNVGPATVLPSSIAAAAMWNQRLDYVYGSVIGRELSAYGINVNLGGNINMTAREPRDGRTFETKGEDPLLAGLTTAAHLRAIQDQHVLAGIKHFAFNDQETERMYVNAIIDERAARETDLLGFEIGIKHSNVQSVMCSYNLVNSAYACNNNHLLNEVLKGDWGFKGFVMSDWIATVPMLADPTIYSPALGGLDQEQPFGIYFDPGVLKTEIQYGIVPQQRLDDMVHRILRAMFAAGLIDFQPSPHALDLPRDEAIAQQVEEQGAVLLKNVRRQLPLDPDRRQSIAIIGAHADIGVLTGGGSAQVMPTGGPALTESAAAYTGGNPLPPYMLIPVFGQVFPFPTACIGSQIWIKSSPLIAIEKRAPRASVHFDDGTNLASAASLAAASDVAIVFASRWETENCDLNDLNMTNHQDDLIDAVAAANPHTIVVLENGGPVVMPWLEKVSAVLEAWFPGQRGGEAIASLLYGDANPSGKLPLTFPKSVADLPHPNIPFFSTPNPAPFNVPYDEGLLVGYKWYDAKNIDPLFPFGFGLSYSTFAYSDLDLRTDFDRHGSPEIDLSFKITNTSNRPGAEIAQVYLALPSKTGEPPRRLVGWQKVWLGPHETRRIFLEIDSNAASHPLSYWDTPTNRWKIASGQYKLFVGKSSRELNLMGTFNVPPSGR